MQPTVHLARRTIKLTKVISLQKAFFLYVPNTMCYAAKSNQITKKYLLHNFKFTN